MNTFLLTAALFALGAQDVQTETQPTTQLYVKTVPSGADISIDGKTLGKSDGLFNIAPGTHKLVLQMDGYASEERSINAPDEEITRIEVELTKPSSSEVVLGYVGDSTDDWRSFADSGHAVAFERPTNTKSIAAVKLFAARYGHPKAPDEDFHLYLLDQNQKVLEHISIPYDKINRGDLRWYTLTFPAVEVPEEFLVAVWFNAERTKGVYLGMDKEASGTHSYVGLPDKGFQKVDQPYDWMIRAVVSSEAGHKPTHPKITTYEAERAADTESTEAQPVETDEASFVRTWSDATGDFTLDAQFAGVKQDKVMLKKSDGKTIAVAVDRLSKADRAYVARQTDAKQDEADSGPGEVRELSHDNGQMAGKSSIAGGGHAVRFKVDGDSWYVTSVRLHGSRYGEPRAPKEDFNVWLCDAQLKPFATFRFPYGAYTRGNPGWKRFRIRPTRVPAEFVVCFGFNPQRTKGVYVSYDDKPSDDSMIGLPDKGEPKPFAKGNWLIRCGVKKSAGGDTKP